MSSGPATLATAALVVLGVGCGASAGARAPTTNPPAAAPVTAPQPSASPAEGFATLDELAARGQADAPLMREHLRVEHAAPRAPDVKAERDLCLRALYAGPRPVRIWFADGAGAVRGEPASGAAGSVPPRGPVCVRKGETVHLVVESADGPSAEARAVIFAAP